MEAARLSNMKMEAQRMPIDPRMVKWDESPQIDPKMVKWDDGQAKPLAEPATKTDKIVRGIRDPFDGAAQLFEKVMPEGFNSANRSVNNWLADKLPGVFAKLDAGGVDSLVKQQEREYQAKRAAAGESGFDGYRTFGNVVSPANLAIAAKLPAATSFAGKVGVGALGGGVSALSNPVTDGEFWKEKAKQAGVGAIGGGVVPALTGAVSRVISPAASTNADLALLKASGVRPTVGQSLGGAWNKAEEKLQSVPIFGDAITAARNRASGDLNTAGFNRALAPIGEMLPAGKTGNEAVSYVGKRLGEAYDSLLPKMTVMKDQAYSASISGLRQIVDQGAIGNGAKKQFNRFIDNEIEPLFQGQGSVTGETFKRLQSKITDQIKNMSASQDADQRLLGQAYKELGDQLNQLSVRSNPGLAKELQAINLGWANFKRVQRAASSVAAEDGVFSPAQLHNAVKAADRSKDKARFAEGNALMQDLSSAGKNLLSGKVPNSGTVDRSLLIGGALGSGLYNPMIPAAALGGAALYTPQAQAALRALVSSRPQGAKAIADSFEKSAPLLIPGGAQVGLGLLN